MQLSNATSSTQELTVSGNDGESLFYRAWRPNHMAPRAVLLIVPGFKSYSGRYAWAGAELAKAGYAVYALDLRGRGRSEGAAYTVSDFDEYVDDVDAVASAVKSKEGDIPFFVAGHSAGAVIALLYTLKHGAEIAGVVAMSIAQELPAPGFALALFKMLSGVLPRVPILKLKAQDFTRDPSVLASMNADPFIATETEPLQTVAALVRAGERLSARIPQLKVPVLFLHGTADHAARPSGSEHLYEAARSADKQLKMYDGVLHEPLADVGRKQVMEDLLGWLEQRQPQTAGVSTFQSRPSATAAMLGTARP